MTKPEARMLMERASEGDPEAFRELFMAVQFREAMEQIFNTHELRAALIIIGRHYGGAKCTELSETFKTNRMDIWRILRNAQNTANN